MVVQLSAALFLPVITRRFLTVSSAVRSNMDVSKIENNEIKSVASGELKENDVRLVGVGVEELGIENFVQGNFFAGELFIDTNKKVYSALGFKRFSFFGVLKALFTWDAKAAIARGKEMKLGGDMSGDGLQNGGALVVDTGGKVLFSFKQEGLSEHVSNDTFLKVLGLSTSNANPTGTQGTSEPVCNDDVCTLPAKKTPSSPQ